jgi:hypothetical protein
MLTVIKNLGCRKKPGTKKPQSWALVECSFCGQQVERLLSAVSKGENPSCGCAKSALIAARKTKHGHKVGYRKTKKTSVLYMRWCHVKERCYNPNNKSYDRYGAKGITVCDEWHDFENFQQWSLANGYQEHLEIDRKDSSLGYTPDNCMWVTKLVNGRNRSNSTMSMEKARLIRQDYQIGMVRKQLREKHQESKTVIDFVLSGHTWYEEGQKDVKVLPFAHVDVL